jgi:hypothetical protein
MILTHYAESFSPRPGACFRLACRPDAEGQPIHCGEPPKVTGIFLAANGRRYEVESSSGHSQSLVNFRRK